MQIKTQEFTQFVIRRNKRIRFFGLLKAVEICVLETVTFVDQGDSLLPQ